MKNKTQNTLKLILLSIICLTFASCKKEPEVDMFNMQPSQIPVNSKRKTVSKLPEKTEEKVIISVENFGRMDPFLPYREKNLVMNSTRKFSDIPMPPGTEEQDPTLNELVKAKVTGILYDKEKPSAIVNISGEDNLVRAGDFISDFYIDAIGKDYVLISVGLNSYKAGIGQIVEGHLSTSSIPQIKNRFAGNKNPGISTDIVEIKSISDENTYTEDLSIPSIEELEKKW